MNRMKKYMVLLTIQQDGPVEWKDAREFHADSHRDAALLAFRLLPPGPIKSAFHRDMIVRAWVWLDNSPKHDTGAPICVHGLDLAKPVAA